MSEVEKAIFHFLVSCENSVSVIWLDLLLFMAKMEFSNKVFVGGKSTDIKSCFTTEELVGMTVNNALGFALNFGVWKFEYKSCIRLGIQIVN